MNSHRLYLITTTLILALTLAACAPATVPPVPTTAATPQPTKNLDDLPLIYYSRSGGIVGFCDKVTIFGGGWAQVTSCHNNATSQITLSSDQKAKIAFWQANMTEYKYDQSNGDVPDGMSISIVFSGIGKGSASSDDQKAMMTMASDLAQAASK